MNYTDIAQKVCSKIVEAADRVKDIKMFSMPFSLDISLDGTTYEAVVVDPETGMYSNPPHVEEVQVKSLRFPCKDFSISNGTAVFYCIDPIDASMMKCTTFGYIANKIRAAGVESIKKAVVQMRTNEKVQTAAIQDVEFCNLTYHVVFSEKQSIVLYCIELDKVLDLNYTPIIEKIAEAQMNNDRQFSESMRTLGKRFYEDDTFHDYAISFTVKGYNAAKRMNVKASTIEDAMKSFNERAADELHGMQVTKVINITCDGKMVSKPILDKVNSSMLDECDGAAGGDASGAVGGDAAGATACDAGDTAAEMAGTTTSDVLGTCKPGEGYMGKDNFYIPARAKCPLHRWETANGGSKRKKKGKYPYEKDMKVVVSMFEDDKQLNEWGDPHNSYEFLHGKTWEQVVNEIKSKAKNPNDVVLPSYERWEAAQFDAPDESTHGKMSGCTVDEDQYKRQYLKEFYIHGIYQDGTFFELGPMKRKVASEYINMHKLSVNSRAFDQMADRGFSEVKTIGTKSGPLHIAKFKDGFYLVDGQSFKCGPFSNKQLARMYAFTFFDNDMEKGPQKDKTDQGYELEYPTFAFSYTMAGVPCMDIVVAEDLPRAMKQFDFQWRVFDNSRPIKDKFNTVEDLQRDLSLLRIKDIEIEELNAGNVEEYEELADATGNPSTIPELQKRCRNPNFKYILGRENAKGKRLVVKPFTESIDESIRKFFS